jgi:hypothetical protein
LLPQGVAQLYNEDPNPGGRVDDGIQDQIERLVAEEHELLNAEPDPAREARLEAVKVELDRCWDLLRQRRGREEFGLDPDAVHVRDADTVEHYEQ